MAKKKPAQKGRPLVRPQLTKAEKKAVRKWLLFKAREAERTLKAWIDAGPGEDSKYYEGQKTFYKHRIAAAKWFASTLPKETVD